VLSCDSGGDDAIFYKEYYMLFIGGAVDDNQLLPIGETSDNGSFEYNNKSSFPTLFNHTDVVMMKTSSSPDSDETFQLNDYTDGTFRILFKKEGEFSAFIYEPNFILEDKVNIFNITLSSENETTISRIESTGNFNIIFNVQDKDGSPIEGVSIYMQYNMFGNIEEPLFRPTTRIDFSVADASTIRFVIELLDGTIIQEWTDSYTGGSEYFTFIPPENEITGGLQLYKYSMEVLEEGQPDERNDESPFQPTSYSLSYNYPNPFN